jgi:hypothetical protein
LATDLTAAGVRVWIDEAEIVVGDSLIQRIGAGIDAVDYLAVVLSPEATASAWVQKEVEIAMTREISGRTVKVLPLIYRPCSLPPFLEGKLYADFTRPESYESALRAVLHCLGVPAPDRVVIFDLGGGTMDAATVRVSPDYVGRVDVKALAADLRSLGEAHAKRIQDTRDQEA